MATKHFPKGLDGRMRDQNGEIRQKRSDTKVDTLRKTYGDDFAKGTALTVQELSRWSAMHVGGHLSRNRQSCRDWQLQESIESKGCSISHREIPNYAVGN